MLKRHLATSSTAAAYAYTVGQLLADAPSNIIPVGEDLVSQFVFFGTGADNSTFTVQIWGLIRCENADGTIDENNYALAYLGLLTATLGTGLGATGGTAVPPTTGRLADGLTWAISSELTTPKGPMTAIETAFAEGTSGVFNPADNSFGILYIPAIGRLAGIFMDYKLGTATSMNCLYSTDKI